MRSMDWILVGVGGGIGSVCRYLIVGLAEKSSAALGIPLGTLLVNGVGCLLVGMALGCMHLGLPMSAAQRLLLVTGFLGGFTTFSAFGGETLTLLRADAPYLALLNIALNVLLSLTMVWIGFRGADLFCALKR